MNTTPANPRVLVTGLGGAPFALLKPMATQAWLPNIARVLAEGSHGILNSTIPPLTAPAWTSFLTGQAPGRHGVFSFQRRLDASLEREFVNADAIRAPRLWDWLAQSGLSSGTINVPMTWPPSPVPAGSYLVSGMLTPDTSYPFTDPPELADELRIPTDLTIESIQESFAAPVTISFWKLPKFIKLLKSSGFSPNRHRLHWLGLLAMPVVFLAMVLIGAAFSMRHMRFGGLGYMALGCMLSGFGYFFLSAIASALGASGAVPVLIAAWAPPVSAVLLALGLLLHLEDG